MYVGGLVDYKMWLCTQGKKVAKFELGPKDILASLLLDQQLFAQSCAFDQFTKNTKRECKTTKHTQNIETTKSSSTSVSSCKDQNIKVQKT